MKLFSGDILSFVLTCILGSVDFGGVCLDPPPHHRIRLACVILRLITCFACNQIVFRRYTFVCASTNFGGANMLIPPYSTTGTLPNVQIVN